MQVGLLFNMTQSLLVIELLGLILICSGISATILLALSKWGAFEWYQIHRGRLPDVCLFCIGFWLCLIQSILLYLFFNANIFYIAIPLAGAAITKVLYAGSFHRPG